MSLSAFYGLWVDALYLLVEMENALANDQSLQWSETARGDPAEPRSPYKLQRAIETHERFARSYLDGFFAEPATALWRYTRGLCGTLYREAWFKEVLGDTLGSYAAMYVERLPQALTAALDDIKARGAGPDDPLRQRLLRACEVLEREDMRFLAEIKSVLREGVRTFEHHGQTTLEQGGRDLLSAVSQLPEVLAHYAERVYEALRVDGWRIELDGDARRRMLLDVQDRTEVLVSTPLWTMEEDRERKIVLLTRSAAPVASLEELVTQNEQVIAKMAPHHRDYGIVVDTRQAPQRNDADFEGAMSRLRRECSARYNRVAVLLISAMGVLQVRRIGRSDEASTYATQSREAAIKFAMAQTRAQREDE